MPRLNPNKEERKKNSERYSANEGTLQEVQPFLKYYFQDHSCLVSHMTILSNIIHERFGLKVDRQARRFKSQFFCWYAENWDTIKPFLLQNSWESLLSTVNPSISSRKERVSPVSSIKTQENLPETNPLQEIPNSENNFNQNLPFQCFNLQMIYFFNLLLPFNMMN